MVGVGDGEDKHPLQRWNDVEIDALQAGRVAGGAVMDDDVLVALAADDVDGGLDLADRGVAGIELQAHAAAAGAAQQRRSEEGPGGKAGCRTCRTWWSPYH